jgi:hypothetical protein
MLLLLTLLLISSVDHDPRAVTKRDMRLLAGTAAVLQIKTLRSHLSGRPALHRGSLTCCLLTPPAWPDQANPQQLQQHQI